MKTAHKLIPAFVLAVTASTSHAYYLTHALAGTVSFAVSGACAIPVTTTKAYLANVHDDEQNLLGWGIVTAAGQLLALKQNEVEIRYHHDYTSGEKRAAEYIDFVGEPLETFLTVNGVRCDIARLEPDVDSKVAYVWSDAHGRVNLKAGFGGYEKGRCNDFGDRESCKARKINGTIGFRGSW